MKEGTSAVPVQSVLDEQWWAHSMECCCYPRNIQDLLSDGKTLYERRFAVPFYGTVIPFGAMVQYHPISAEDLSHQFGPKVLPGTFFGFVLSAGGVWKVDILVADIEELQEMDASELHARRLNAMEVLTPMSSEKFTFPIADGTVTIYGGDQVLRTSTLIRDRPDRGEKRAIFKENQTDLLQPHIETHRGMMVIVGMISGPLQGTLFTVTALNRESNCTCGEQNHFLFHWNIST